MRRRFCLLMPVAACALLSSSSPSFADSDSIQLLPPVQGTSTDVCAKSEGNKILTWDKENPLRCNKNVVISDAGYVGIGTNNPIYMVHINNNNYGFNGFALEGGRDASNNLTNRSVHLFTEQGGSLVGMEVAQYAAGDTRNWQLGQSSDARFVISHPGTSDSLTIAPTGQVGIHAQYPGSALQIHNDNYGYYGLVLEGGKDIANNLTGRSVRLFTEQGGGMVGMEVGQYAAGNALNWQLGQFTDGRLVIGHPGDFDTVTIAPNHNVGIGSQIPNYKLSVNGTVFAQGGFVPPSDERLKKNIQDLKIDGLAVVSKLRPVTFEWKAPQDDSMQGVQVGFIAQDVEKVFPQVITTQKDANQTKALKYDQLIPVLTKAIQEQQKEIEELRAANKKQLESFEAELKDLKSRIK